MCKCLCIIEQITEIDMLNLNPINNDTKVACENKFLADIPFVKG